MPDYIVQKHPAAELVTADTAADAIRASYTGPGVYVVAAVEGKFDVAEGVPTITEKVAPSPEVV
jgi:hypothetical protein